MNTRLLFLPVLLVMVLSASAGWATTVMPRTWQELVLEADFIGIVECQTAGGIVAKYKVIESWWGPPPGTELHIRMGVNFWGPQFPIALCEERYLVTASKSGSPDRIVTTSGPGGHPLWWRDIPADYTLPFYEGFVRLPLSKGPQPLSSLGSDEPNVDAYRKAVSPLVEEKRRRAAQPKPAATTRDQEEPDQGETDLKRAPTQQELTALRTAMNRETDSEEWGETFRILTVHDPATVAQWLADWVNPHKEWWDEIRGYLLASDFAHFCGKNRAVNMRTLLAAKEPSIRVAGAVYLCFEDEKEGTARLTELTKLEGDPGVWAALSLARRGDKSAMPRALRVFQTAAAGGMETSEHLNLQLRLRVLLSNSAKNSGLPQPSPPSEEQITEVNDDTVAAFQKKTYDYWVGWWKVNDGKVILADPWLPLLAKRKVD